ncbi:MAG: hypothetical protein V2I43_18295 [Parvularcula sp.]|nr:hypothetical protein [Parvularcula sp.]
MDMPIEYRISNRLDFSFFRWKGIVTLDQYLRSLRSYVNEPNFRPGRTELVDTSRLEDFATNFNGMMAALRSANAEYKSPFFRARTIIWSPRDYIFGLSRMMQQIADVNPGIIVEVFRDEREVLSILGFNHESVSELEADLNSEKEVETTLIT